MLCSLLVFAALKWPYKNIYCRILKKCIVWGIHCRMQSNDSDLPLNCHRVICTLLSLISCVILKSLSVIYMRYLKIWPSTFPNLPFCWHHFSKALSQQGSIDYFHHRYAYQISIGSYSLNQILCPYLMVMFIHKKLIEIIT